MYDECGIEHFRPLGWRDMPMEDQDHRELVEREARDDAIRASREPSPRDRWRERDNR